MYVQGRKGVGGDDRGGEASFSMTDKREKDVTDKATHVGGGDGVTKKGQKFSRNDEQLPDSWGEENDRSHLSSIYDAGKRQGLEGQKGG